MGGVWRLQLEAIVNNNNVRCLDGSTGRGLMFVGMGLLILFRFFGFGNTCFVLGLFIVA